jgi:hypothetical protein
MVGFGNDDMDNDLTAALKLNGTKASRQGLEQF